MKKLLPLLVIFAIMATPLWAKKRAKTADEIPDMYDDGEVTAIPTEESKRKKKDYSADPYSKEVLKPKNERTIGQRLFGMNKFQQIEAFSVYAKSSAGKLHLKKKASLIHRAGTDIGGFFTYYDTSAYAVQFSKQARAALISAINQYFDDFENKRLDRNLKKKKTEAVYGMAEAYEEYGLSLVTLTHSARPKVCFGYEFIKGNPYFAIYAKKTKDLSYTTKTDQDSNWENTIPQRYYFTKAQANTLATFLSDSNIDSLRVSTSYDDSLAESDAYENETQTPEENTSQNAETSPATTE